MSRQPDGHDVPSTSAPTAGQLSLRRRVVHRAAMTTLPLVAAALLAGCANPAGATHVSAGATAAPTAGTKIPAAVLARRVQAAVRTAGTVQFRLSEDNIRCSGTFDLRPADLRASMTLKKGRKTIRAVVLPRVTYLNLGQTFKGMHWVRVEEPAHNADIKEMRVALVAALAMVDPAFQARAWALGGPFTAGQTANLGSEMATEYDATLTEAAMMAALPPEARRAFKAMDKATDKGGDKNSDPATLRVWLNERSLPLKIELAWTEGKKHEHSATTYVNWHTASRVNAPPSRDVLTGKF
jgi:hypothetical protein